MSLPLADGNQRIDDFRAGNERPAHEIAFDNWWRRGFQRTEGCDFRVGQSVKRASQGIDNAPQKRVADADIQRAPCRLYRLSGGDAVRLFQDNRADRWASSWNTRPVLPSPKRSTSSIRAEGQAAHPGDAIADAYHAAALADAQAEAVAVTGGSGSAMLAFPPEKTKLVGEIGVQHAFA